MSRVVQRLVDPYVVPERGQPLVGQLRPACPPAFQQRRAVPVALLGAKRRIRSVGLLTGHHIAHRQQHMRMRPQLAVLAHRAVHAKIGHYAARHELLTSEVLGQGNPLGA
jgi:hypothetical protein